MVAITFVLPGIARHPIGGYKVVYAYANDLQESGHSVTLAHLRNDSRRRRSLKNAAVTIDYFLRGNRPPKWSALNRLVKTINRPTLDGSAIPPCDILVATSVSTAHLVAELQVERACRGVYFLQGFEDFSTSREEVIRSWRLPLARIVVSQWLKDTADSLGLPAHLVQNGVDTRIFRAGPNMDRRQTDVLAMLSPYPWKRTDLALEVMSNLLEVRPSIAITTFGVGRRPTRMDRRIRYVHEPSQMDLTALYQGAKVHLTTSDFEGFGLPALEAMACGCVVVTTDNGGVPSFAGDAAIVVERGDSDQIVQAITRVLTRRDVADDYNRKSLERASTLSCRHASRQFEANLVDLLSVVDG